MSKTVPDDVEKSVRDSQELDTEQTIEKWWGQIKESWTATCEEELERRKNKHKPWIYHETLDKIDQRKKV